MDTNYTTDMVIVKRSFKSPYYLSESFEVNVAWSENFTAALEKRGEDFGVSTELIAQVKANNSVIQCLNQYEVLLTGWLGMWRGLKEELLTSPPASSSPLPLPSTPDLPMLPAAVAGYVFAPHIEAASILLANRNFTDNDCREFGLVKAAGKPVPPQAKHRERVSEFNFPVLKQTLKNGVVNIRIVRGRVFKNSEVLIMVDREGKGNFVKLTGTVAKEVMDPVVLPEGVLTASWTYKAIYVLGDTPISDWSGPLYVSVRHEAPVLAAAA